MYMPVLKGIQGVSKIKDGYNPATWMLEVTTSSKERELGIDYAEVYKNSELYRYFHLYEIKSNQTIELENNLLQLFQEKQSTYQRIEYSSTRFEISLFCFAILEILLDTMHGLLMETTLVLLAQS